MLFYSLPEDFTWFEPPTVCRWETVEETEASEKIEDKPSDRMIAQQSLKKSKKSSKQKQVTVEDFNLLDIPPTIDINFIVREIIVPRIPDGYKIAVSSATASQRRQSVIFKPNESFDNETASSIGNIFVPSDSPRSLHPKLTIKTNVKVLERPPHQVKNGKAEYLFSKLLEDLESLYEKQLPCIRRQMDEISEMLSMSVVDEQEEPTDTNEVETNTEDALKTGTGLVDDFPWSFVRKADEEIAEVVEKEESDEDDDLIDIDDNMDEFE